MAEQNELERRADELYEKYAKPLEQQHVGKYIVVSRDGHFLIGDTMLEVAKLGAQLGRGNFLFKLGPRSVGKWR